MRLSANFLRPERRSTDGQVILKRTSGRSENRPDLLFCGQVFTFVRDLRKEPVIAGLPTG